MKNLSKYITPFKDMETNPEKVHKLYLVTQLVLN